MNHPAIPPRVSWPWIAVAAATWVVTTITADSPPVPFEDGEFHGEILLVSDVRTGRFGPWAIGEVDGGRVLLELASNLEVGRGDRLRLDGRLEATVGNAFGWTYGAILEVEEVRSVQETTFWPHLAGRQVRDTVLGRLAPFDPGRALLAGFLIGETSHMGEQDVESMRRSGLAHFTAVSGSNVALFLALLFVMAGPLATGPARRAVIGLIGLPIYVAATGFEPSVMRAGAMAAIVLTGRLAGLVLEAWQVFSLAVGLLLVAEPAFASNAGFQLSVLATSGVLVGARWPAGGTVARSLAVTLGAQLAVAPLLFAHFGSVPLLAPLVNLLAAPLVTAATLCGALGTAGLTFLIGPAAWMASVVLALARGAQDWPQLSSPIALGLVALFAAAIGVRWARVPALGLGSVVVVWLVLNAGGSLAPGDIAVLDVGQGDAILMHGGEGRYALVDGGPDPVLVLDKLRHYGVHRLELVVLTHVHADHATGLTAVLDTFAVEEAWAALDPHESPAAEEFLEAAGRVGLPVFPPPVGHQKQLGDLALRVAGPLRRYKSPNDQSLVLSVRGPGRSILLSGDIETFAQAELGHLRADVLKVPHQGAGTSSLDWLTGVGAELAIISVGSNQFGHPVPWVVEALEGAGAEVIRTDQAGDVVVSLAR